MDMKKYKIDTSLYLNIDTYDYDRKIFHSSFSLLIEYVENNYGFWDYRKVDLDSIFAKCYYGFVIYKKGNGVVFDFSVDEKIIDAYLWYTEYIQSVKKDILQNKNKYIKIPGSGSRNKTIRVRENNNPTSYYQSRYNFKNILDEEDEQFIKFAKIRKHLFI